MTVLHPRKNGKGLPVDIRHPSQPSALASWADPSQPAIAVPNCPLPALINGVPATRAVPPDSPDGWEHMVVDKRARSASPLSTPHKKKLSAGAVIREPDGRIWLVEPTNGFGGYVRTFPKGTIEPGYSLAATAAKEAFEEAGLLVEIGPPLADVERTTSVCRYFLARRVGGTPSDMGWETQAVCLIPHNLLSQMAPAKTDKPILVALSELEQRV